MDRLQSIKIYGLCGQIQLGTDGPFDRSKHKLGIN